MNTLKQIFLAIFLPLLAITHVATAMDMKALVEHQINKLIKKPLKHKKYLSETSATHVVTQNGSYLGIQDKDALLSNAIRIAQQQERKETDKFKLIRSMYEPKNKLERTSLTNQYTKQNHKLSTLQSDIDLFKVNLATITSNKTKKAIDEIIQRPFNHAKFPITVKLTENPKIGYLDTTGIEDFNEILSVQAHDPFVTITQNIDEDKLTNVVCEQISAEHKECTTLLNKLTSHDRAEQTERCKTRKNELYTSFNELKNWTIPALLPVKYLQNDEPLTLKDGSSIYLDFKDDKKLHTLLASFKQQPTTLFCHLTAKSAHKIRVLEDGESLTPDEEKSINAEVDAKKIEFRNRQIIERKEVDYTIDLQEYSHKLLPDSDIVTHDSNYHLHGENGYSEKRTRDEALAHLNPNAFGLLNDRQGGYKKRKITSQEEAFAGLNPNIMESLNNNKENTPNNHNNFSSFLTFK